MKARFTVIGFSLCLLLASGCGAPTFPNENSLGSLRILALIADKPEANPGDTVTITPILSDLNGGGRALTYSVTGCVDPGEHFGEDQNCVGVPFAQVIEPAATRVVSLGGTANYAGVVGFSASNYTGAAASFVVTLPGATTAFRANDGQQLPDYEQFNGASYLLDYRLSAADGSASVRAIKRILVSKRTTKNQNPTLTALTKPDGTNLTTLPTSEENLSPVFGVGAEQYQVELSSGGFTTLGESVDVSWYSTDGNFTLNDSEGSLSNTYWPPTPPPTTHQTVLLGIVHDGRGGDGALMLAF